VRFSLPLASAFAAGVLMLCGVAQSPPNALATPLAQASDAATAAPEAACPVDVMAVVPLPGNGITSTYAAVLATPRTPGLASGTLWVNTSMGPFHVPFVHRRVIGVPYNAGDDPIVFTIPAAGTLLSVFVDTLGDAPPCPAVAPWVPTYTPLIQDSVRRPLMAALADPEPPAGSTSISDPTACRLPDMPARVLEAAQVISAPGLGGGVVQVRVHLAKDSSILSADVVDPNSGVRYYNLRALAAARASVYATAMVNCRPVEYDYVFSIRFN